MALIAATRAECGLVDDVDGLGDGVVQLGPNLNTLSTIEHLPPPSPHKLFDDIAPLSTT